ncbi:MAG: ABC transporter permease [Thermodesulfobacteriota bacterium]
MRPLDLIGYSGRALAAGRLRSGLIGLAMGIGVAAVFILTGIGDAARLYITGQFASLGTNLIIVLPGRAETTGSLPPLLGETPRDLTLADARALLDLPMVANMAPVVVGSAPVAFGGREREVTILGTSAAYLTMRHLHMARGSFLPAESLFLERQVCVLGTKLAAELFGAEEALGQLVRIGGRRSRVIGLLGSLGVSMGVDLDELAVVPVASAQALFDSESLFRVIIEARDRQAIAAAQDAVRQTIRQRHDGEDDVTVITQDAVLATFDRILAATTLIMGGIAAVSLVVAGVLVMNVMLVAVSQRTVEIGLLKALGATAADIRRLFLAEAVCLGAGGGLAGVLAGLAVTAGLRAWLPDLPIRTPFWAAVAAVGVAVATGLLFSILPASRAARLEPIQALGRR